MTKFLDLDLDVTLGGNSPSDYKIPSQKALKTYIDNNSGGGTVDQTYNSSSANAQSGVAIAGAGFITGISSTDVTTALGYTPYSDANPNGYTSNVGTVTSVNNVAPVNGNVSLTIPTVPTALSSFTDDLGSSPTHTHSQYLTSHQDISGKEDIAQPVTSLAASGTISLLDNTVNKISATGTVTFSLPSISDTAKFHQILVQLYMSSARTINFGTSYYFGGSAPSMSTAGYYTIIYEYDNVRGGWVVGALKKAS